MRMKKYAALYTHRFVGVLCLLCLLLTGCGAKGVNGAPKAVTGDVREPPERLERTLDFPFNPYDEQEAGYTLTLISPGEESGSCGLRLCDGEGRVLQQLSCGILKEPVEISYDSLTYGNDLQIFSSGSPTGLLFIWRDENLFSEKAIEIPRYEEVGYLGFMGRVENQGLIEKTIYQVNEAKGRTERIRSWSMDPKDSFLKIWDYLENKAVYQGKVRLNQEGRLVNEEYYEYLFWDGLSPLLDYEPDSAIPTWVMGGKTASQKDTPDESGFEMVQEQLFGNTGFTAEYGSRQEILEDFGFWGKEPLYRYYDRFGNLCLELYLDQESENGCGIAYEYGFSSDLEKVTSFRGFTLDSIMEVQWNNPDSFCIKSVNGADARDSVEDFSEEFTYREDGKLADYSSTGKIHWLKDNPETRQDILKLHFLYRDDGSLFYRQYAHNSWIFGSTFSGINSYYDGRERLVYEHAYITHGGLEYYYIYENNKTQPLYALCLDRNAGYVIPTMIRYRQPGPDS